MDDLNNPILLIGGHFVIGGEAEAAAEEIRADIDAGTFNICICAAAAVTFGGDEGVGAVDGLHVHGLPSTLSTHHVRTNRFALLFTPTSQLFY